MNLRELEYLVAVDEERHFHRAAERCFVSQPTLSGQLKKLEQELGVLLVERNNRNVIMTEVGSAVADQARKVLAEAKGVAAIAQMFQDPMVGDLNVGLISTLAPYLLPIIMLKIKKRYSRLNLWLHEHQTSVLVKKLRSGDLDLLILALPVEPAEFTEIQLFSESFLLAVPKREKFSTKSKITVGDLEDQEMLLLEEGHCLRGQALDVCFMAGAREQPGFRATSLETLRHMVGEGMGMTLLPELSVPRRQYKDDPIEYLQFNKPKPSRKIGMLYRNGSYREQTFKNLAQLISVTVKNY